MSDTSREPRPRVVLPEQVAVVNVGLPMFGEALRAQGVRVVDVAWRIPAGGDEALVQALTQLYGPAAATVASMATEASALIRSLCILTSSSGDFAPPS